MVFAALQRQHERYEYFSGADALQGVLDRFRYQVTELLADRDLAELWHTHLP
jgi:hypothetical protein